MSLDLSPEIETAVRQYAAREGVTVDELLARSFPLPAQDVLTLLAQWQQEYGLPERPGGRAHIPVRDLFSQWDAEDAQRTPEEIRAEERLWEDLERAHREM